MRGVEGWRGGQQIRLGLQTSNYIRMEDGTHEHEGVLTQYTRSKYLSISLLQETKTIDFFPFLNSEENCKISPQPQEKSVNSTHLFWHTSL